MNILKKIRNALVSFQKQERQNEAIRYMIGQLLVENLKPANSISDSEFKVFSQFGDDGIIQCLIRMIPSIPNSFIEFGVESYLESNTRFLLKHNNWRGLIIDGDPNNIEYIKRDDIYWQHDLTAVASFITTESINNLIQSNGFSGKIGVLSIDIDGNDYWVWNSMTVVQPVIVIIEYNSVFGFDRSITVPYDPAFVRHKAHYSHLYFGASLSSLVDLGKEKGYAFIGCNKAGNNAYFILEDMTGLIQRHTVESGFVQSMFRESRDVNNKLSFLSIKHQKELISKMKVFNTRTKRNEFL